MGFDKYWCNEPLALWIWSLISNIKVIYSPNEISDSITVNKSGEKNGVDAIRRLADNCTELKIAKISCWFKVLQHRHPLSTFPGIFGGKVAVPESNSEKTSLFWELLVSWDSVCSRQWLYGSIQTPPLILAEMICGENQSEHPNNAGSWIRLGAMKHVWIVATNHMSLYIGNWFPPINMAHDKLRVFLNYHVTSRFPHRQGWDFLHLSEAGDPRLMLVVGFGSVNLEASMKGLEISYNTDMIYPHSWVFFVEWMPIWIHLDHDNDVHLFGAWRE